MGASGQMRAVTRGTPRDRRIAGLAIGRPSRNEDSTHPRLGVVREGRRVLPRRVIACGAVPQDGARRLVASVSAGRKKLLERDQAFRISRGLHAYSHAVCNEGNRRRWMRQSSCDAIACRPDYQAIGAEGFRREVKLFLVFQQGGCDGRFCAVPIRHREIGYVDAARILRGVATHFSVPSSLQATIARSNEALRKDDQPLCAPARA